MAGWMSGKNVKVKKTTQAEGAGGGWKEGDKVNCRIERAGMDSTDNESVIAQHGSGADKFPNIMLRVLGDKDGRFAKACLFHKLFIFSENAVRAAGDCQYLATYAAIKDEEDPGYYDDLINTTEEPDNDILADLIGLEVGITVGVMDNNGRQSQFVRKVSMPFDWDKEAEADAGKSAGGAAAGGRRGRSAGGSNATQSAQTQTRARGRAGR